MFARSTYRKKNKEICQEIKSELPDQMILKSNAKYITKVIYEKEVAQILSMLSLNNRLGTKIYIKHPHKPTSKSSLIRQIRLYNALTLDLKAMNPKQIKRKLKKMTASFKD